LAKLDQLALIGRLFGEEIFVPSLVVDEVLRPPLPPGEELCLQRFLDSCTVVVVQDSGRKSLSLSSADLAVCQLAIERDAALVLSDDKLLRSLLTVEGLVPMGTLGLLMHAAKKDILPRSAVRVCIDELVGKYNLRISIALYEHFLEKLARA